MEQLFQNFLTDNQWFQKEEKGLLALSGGIDSMVLAHLLLAGELSFGIAHCNFQLRGSESDEDQLFVKKFAKKIGVPFFTTKFKTEDFAQENGLSIQVAARQLRYQWLEKVRQMNAYDYVLTAHQQNDSIETLLYNLSKGSGIRGLHGIPRQNATVIRPLLFASREEVIAYAKENKIAFREDSSNASNKYHRNLIRQKVIPVLKEINPALENTFSENIERFKEVEWLYDFALASLKKELVEVRGSLLAIDLSKLQEIPARVSILYEWLKEYGFNSRQIKQVFTESKTASGRIFSSNSHELLMDRNELMLRKISPIQEDQILIDKDCKHLLLPEGHLELHVLDESPRIFPDLPNHVFLPLSRLKFPLHLRRWQAGDTFQPFGMDGHHQKLQDYFNNIKLSRFEKEQIWILESEQQVCWIVGHRLDEHFRIHDLTASVLELRWIATTK